MAYDVKILLDSVNNRGVRLVTWELTYPRFVHVELMTHRVFSRSSASSRAIPYNKMRERIVEDPVFPVWWGKNQAGSSPAHRAPLEHVAQSMGHNVGIDITGLTHYGNFQGFKQLRHFVPNEAGPPEPRFDRNGDCINYDPVTRKLRAW